MVVNAKCQRDAQELFPAGSAVALSLNERSVGGLLPEEELHLASANETRRQEFAAGRSCAREALAKLGFPPVAILAGPNGAPDWPTGIIGSITHCDGLVAAVVAPAAVLTSVGIDAEPVDRKLRAGIGRHILTANEQLRQNEAPRDLADGADLTLLAFSAKESVYKCLGPTVKRRIGFHEIEVDFDPAARTFRVTSVSDKSLAGFDLAALRGSYTVSCGYIITGTYVETERT